jgi:hypothetical protein
MNKKTISLIVSVNIFAALMFSSAFAIIAPTPYQNQKYPDLCQILTRTLKYGDQGTDVKKLQIVLGQEGVAYLNASGYYDLPTYKAVKTFQRLAGIYQVGKVGPQTLTRMRSLWCGGNQINVNPVNPTNPVNPQTPFTSDPTILDSSDSSISVFPRSSSGNKVDLAWSAPNYLTCNITNNLTPEISQVSNSGSKIFPIYFETNFKISCANYSGKSFSKIITVRPSLSGIPAPTVTVSINPSSVLVGQGATVYWSSQNASYCSANFSSSNLLTSGSQQVTVTSAQQSFTVTCFNSSGLSTAQSVYSDGTVSPSTNNAPSFTVTPYSSTVVYGQSTTLNLLGTNISTCTVSGGTYSNYNLPLVQTQQYPNNSSSASLTVSPTTSTTYTFNCRSSNGQNSPSQTAFVTVNSSTGGTATLNISPSSGAAPLAVTITPNLNGVTYFGGVTINYGDGTATETICNAGTSNCMIKSHTYNTSGTYTVTITGNTGSQQTVLATSYVVVSGTVANTSSLAITQSGMTATAVFPSQYQSFINTECSNTQARFGGQTFTIDWGDGTFPIQNGKNSPCLQHTYAQTGTYLVKARIFNFSDVNQYNGNFTQDIWTSNLYIIVNSTQ